MKKSLFLILSCILCFVVNIVVTISFYSLLKPVENKNIYEELFVPLVKEEDRDYRILLLADLHILGPYGYEAPQYQLMEEMIFKAEPDLIVFMGDTFVGEDCYTSVEKACSFIDKYKIAWTYVMGNHEIEFGNAEVISYITSKSKYCLFEQGDKEVDGCGNYVLNVKKTNGKIIKNLIFLDTHTSITSKWDNAHENQVSWYRSTVEQLKKDDEDVDSMLFMHIPFTAFLEATEAVNGGGAVLHYGEERYILKNFTDKFNLFETICELDNTKAVFAGHRHLNDCSVTYKGVRLTYCNTGNIWDCTKNGIVGGTMVSIDEVGDIDIRPLLSEKYNYLA